MTTPTGPALQHFRGSGLVLLHGRAVVDVLYLVAIGVRDCQRDGLAPARFQHLLATLSEAATEARAMTPPRHDDVADRTASAESCLDEISTGEAAQLLGLSRRQVQRLARTLGARQVAGGALVVDRGAVEAHRLERRTEEHR